MENELTIGSILKEALIEKNISQALLAETIFVSPHTISRVLKGKHFPNGATFGAMIRVLAPSGENRQSWIEEKESIYKELKKQKNKRGQEK